MRELRVRSTPVPWTASAPRSTVDHAGALGQGAPHALSQSASARWAHPGAGRMHLHACVSIRFGGSPLVPAACGQLPPLRAPCRPFFARIFVVWTLIGLFLGLLDFVFHLGSCYGLNVDQILRCIF